MSDARDATDPQPAPTAGRGPAVIGEVIKDLRDRAEFGKRKYGVDLAPFNTRDALLDAYGEALDLASYLKQMLMEREANS